MIISLLLPLLLVRKRKNIRSSFETRSLGKLVKMMIRWLTDFLCGVFSFKTIFWKRVRAFWVPSSSVHWVFLNPRIRHQRNIRSLRRSLKQEEFFFFWKIENHNYCPTQVLSSCFFLVAKFQNPRHSLNKKQQEQEENILPIFLKFPRLWPPEYFFFGNKRNFYLSLSLSVCVCVSWKRKKKNWPFLLCFGDTFWIFLEELAVKYVWTQNWIFLDATIFWTGQDLKGVDLRMDDFRTFRRKCCPPDERNWNVSRPRSWTKKTKFEIIWKNLKKEFCAGNQKIVPAHRKKTKKIRRENWEFFWWEREEEKRNLHTREKKMSGFFWVFVHPSLFRWRVFARKLNNGGIKENILRKQNKEFCEKEEEEKKKEITTLPYLNVTSRIVYV